jgi:hypothetical protein
MSTRFLAALFAFAVLPGAAALAQSTPSGLDRNPCAMIPVVKASIASDVNNASEFETLGSLEQACGLANIGVVGKNSSLQKAVCNLMIAAGDSFASAAGLALSSYTPEPPGSAPLPTPQEDQIAQNVRDSAALEDWALASKSYSTARVLCFYPRPVDITSPVAQKALNAEQRVVEFARKTAGK